MSSRADEVMSCTARLNASVFACDGFVNPEIFRTNCKGADENIAGSLLPRRRAV